MRDVRLRFSIDRGPCQRSHLSLGYSTENSRAIFIRGGEPWLMSYCWRIQKCQNECAPHAFLEGKNAWETCTRKSTAITLKYIRQQYPLVFCKCLQVIIYKGDPDLAYEISPMYRESPRVGARDPRDGHSLGARGGSRG